MKKIIFILTILLYSCNSNAQIQKEIKQKIENNPSIFETEFVGIKNGILTNNVDLIHWLDYDGCISVNYYGNSRKRLKRFADTGNYIKIYNRCRSINSNFYLTEGDYPLSDEYYDFKLMNKVKVEKIYDIDEDNSTVKVDVSINPTNFGSDYYRINKDALYTVEVNLIRLKGGKYDIDKIYLKPDIKKQTKVKF